jgi:hypothetical protein
LIGYHGSFWAGSGHTAFWSMIVQSCLSATANTQIDLQGDWWIILAKCSPDRFHDIIMECEKVAL